MNVNAIINDQLWKAVPGFPCYDAHPTGLIRNAITGKLISQCGAYTTTKGSEYNVLKCCMRDSNGNWKTPNVHYIIATTFIDIPTIESESNWDVDHIDHNPHNNDVRNLRWLPASINRSLKRNTRSEVARRKILEYYRAHDIDYDYFNLLSEL